MASLNQEQLRRLARFGATAPLEELPQEESAIRAAFPELFGRGRRAAGNGGAAAASAPAASGARKRKMSAANGKAVSERMRKYWAERRKSARAAR